jgi:hypothetical protein
MLPRDISIMTSISPVPLDEFPLPFFIVGLLYATIPPLPCLSSITTWIFQIGGLLLRHEENEKGRELDMYSF